eukprot:4500426-Alexandrium_andersonii.AAC.1
MLSIAASLLQGAARQSFTLTSVASSPESPSTACGRPCVRVRPGAGGCASRVGRIGADMCGFPRVR